MGLRFFVHPASRVADNQLHVGSRTNHDPAIRAGFVQVYVCSGKRELATRWHGVPRIRGKIDDHLLQLTGIGFYTAYFRTRLEIQFDVFSDHALQQLFNISQNLIEIEHLGFENLPPSKSEQLARQGRAASGRLPDHLQAARDSLILRPLEQNLTLPQDDPQQIIEIMGNAAGQSSDGFEFLQLMHVLF
jgi:hypothetical protein